MLALEYMENRILIAISHVFYPKDPAYFRFKMAIRTLISAAIASSIAIPLGFRAMLISILGSMFISATILGHTWLEKLKHAAIFGATILTCFAVGVLVSVNFWVSGSFFIVGAFLAFYVRRFGRIPSMISIPATVLLFIPTLYDTTPGVLWIAFAGLAISVPVAAIVNILLLPERKNDVFLENLADHLRINAKLLSWINEQLQQQDVEIDSRKIFLPLSASVAEILTGNQMICGEFNAKKVSIAKQASEILQCQYSLSKAIGNLLDDIFYLTSEKTEKHVENVLTDSICQALSALASITESIIIINNKIQPQQTDENTQVDTTIKQFKQTLSKYNYKEDVNIIYSYNCYTSIELYWQALSNIRNIHANSD